MKYFILFRVFEAMKKILLHRTAFDSNLDQMSVFLWYSFQHLHRFDNTSGWINIPPKSKYFLPAQ